MAMKRLLLPQIGCQRLQQIAAAIKAAQEKFGHIEVLVNNAGIGYFGSFEESNLDEVRRMFEINVWGLAEMTRQILPGLRKQRLGTIKVLLVEPGPFRYSLLLA
jgi:short-subunit dehydrogenase